MIGTCLNEQLQALQIFIAASSGCVEFYYLAIISLTVCPILPSTIFYYAVKNFPTNSH